MLAIALLSHEPDKLIALSAPGHDLWTPHAISYLVASCVVGLAISFTGWYCRSQVTATCYTVLGVANKMVTVLVNLLIWDEHAGLARAYHACAMQCTMQCTMHRAPCTHQCTMHAPSPCTVHRAPRTCHAPPGGYPVADRVHRWRDRLPAGAAARGGG